MIGKKSNTNDFIIRSKTIHKNRYDYSLVDYKNANTKIKIICPVHGIFEQKPSHHLNGHGCRKCANIQNGINSRHDKFYFIKISAEIHKNRYDYSLVDYTNANYKVKIICPIHGIFEQKPIAHMSQKQGCPKCANNIRLTIEQFTNNSNKYHDNKYDYSLVKYINNRTKVKIICPIHGIFHQIPTDHMRGVGCPICCDSKNEKIIKQILTYYDIYFENQKTFSDCKYKRKLKFDFYLPYNNICIEYDGQQHSTIYRFEKDDSKLKIRQLRDKIKTDYCIKNNIKLIRIKFTDDIIDKLKYEVPL